MQYPQFDDSQSAQMQSIFFSTMLLMAKEQFKSIAPLFSFKLPSNSVNEKNTKYLLFQSLTGFKRLKPLETKIPFLNQ